MDRLADNQTLVILVVVVVVNALVLLVLLTVLRPRDAGLFAPWISPSGPTVCFGASVLFGVLAVIDPPILLNIVVWFAVAIGVFRLTARQAIKLNIAQALIFLALFAALASVAD